MAQVLVSNYALFVNTKSFLDILYYKYKIFSWLLHISKHLVSFYIKMLCYFVRGLVSKG